MRERLRTRRGGRHSHWAGRVAVRTRRVKRTTWQRSVAPPPTLRKAYATRLVPFRKRSFLLVTWSMLRCGFKRRAARHGASGTDDHCPVLISGALWATFSRYGNLSIAHCR